MNDQNRRVFSVLRLCAVAVLLAFAASAPANVGNPQNWKPNFEKPFTAPAPADVEQRAAAFADRNSKANLEALAKEFFSVIDMGKIPPAIGAAYDRHDYAGALGAYRDFFMDRLGKFNPDEAVNLGVRPRKPPIPFEKAWLHTADDLMAGTTVFGMMELRLRPNTPPGQGYYDICNNPANQSTKGNVRIVFGAPGRANWTWQPDGFIPLGFPAYPFDKSFFASATGRPHFFTPLLVQYIESKDAKYWDKWIAYMDDVCINWRRDTMRAGLNPSHFQNNVEFFDDGIWANLSYVMQSSPEMVRGLPAPTLARLLNRMWMEYMSDTLQYARNASTARRIMFDTYHGIRLAVSFPEFKGSTYCIRESIRALESLPMLSIMPDGCDVHDSRNYNKATDEYIEKVYHLLQQTHLAPQGVNDRWLATQRETMLHHADFIIRELYVTGDYPHWELFHPERSVFSGTDPYLKRYLPEAFADADNAAIIANIFGDEKAGKPASPRFTSDAFPFGGYYAIRSGWGKDDQWLYMPCTRPVSSVTRPDNNNLDLYAFGRHLLADRGMGTPVAVDGMNQISNGSYHAYPQSWRNDIYRPMYGRAGSTNAYRTPLERRWHSSEYFDLIEGEYAAPYARTNPIVFVDDVVHQRQVLFARKPGLWIVTDRMKSPTAHDYDWAWPIYVPQGEDARRYPGFKRDQVVSDRREQSIIATGINGPSLSLRSHALAPMELNGMDFKVHGKKDWTVVTSLYPQKFENGAAAPDLSNVETLRPEGGACGFSADVPGGARVMYLAAPAGGAIKLDNLSMTGEALLLTIEANGHCHGVALGCSELSVALVRQQIPGPDFEFESHGAAIEKYSPIYRPLALPVIGPAEDKFAGPIEVTMSHEDGAVEIRYTLDGTGPSGDSPLYAQPVRIFATTVVKARAFRKGVTKVPHTSDDTLVSPVQRALFTQEFPLKPLETGKTQAGLEFTCYEQDGRWPISAFNLEAIKPARTGTCAELFDTRATKMTHGGFAFVYDGYLNIPRDGVWSIHAPREFITPSVHAGYDLRVYIDGNEWYPATQVHNFGVWSTPMFAGAHTLKVVYINQQDVLLMSDLENWKDYYWAGDKPSLRISGPGMGAQAIPVEMLSH